MNDQNLIKRLRKTLLEKGYTIDESLPEESIKVAPEQKDEFKRRLNNDPIKNQIMIDFALSIGLEPPPIEIFFDPNAPEEHFEDSWKYENKLRYDLQNLHLNQDFRALLELDKEDNIH